MQRRCNEVSDCATLIAAARIADVLRVPHWLRVQGLHGRCSWLVGSMYKDCMIGDAWSVYSVVCETLVEGAMIA